LSGPPDREHQFLAATGNVFTGSGRVGIQSAYVHMPTEN
jgi:hypothetical protein